MKRSLFCIEIRRRCTCVARIAFHSQKIDCMRSEGKRAQVVSILLKSLAEARVEGGERLVCEDSCINNKGDNRLRVDGGKVR